MGVVFVVSPVYLEAIFMESKKYQFDFQGYGTFRKASSGLMTVNAADCLGFAFVGVSLPAKGTEEYKAMLDFFSRCNMMRASKKVVLIVQNGIPSSYVKVFKKLSFLRFAVVDRFEFMSDVLINRNLFGSILLDNYKPYQFGRHKQERRREFSCNTLTYKPLVNGASTACIDPFERLESLSLTLENDAVYQSYRKSGSAMVALRRYFITRDFKEDCSKELNDAEASVESLRQDTTAWCLAKSLLRIIEEQETERERMRNGN